MTSSTSGITIENSVLEKTRAELVSISDTVLPSPIEWEVEEGGEVNFTYVHGCSTFGATMKQL